MGMGMLTIGPLEFGLVSSRPSRWFIFPEKPWSHFCVSRDLSGNRQETGHFPRFSCHKPTSNPNAGAMSQCGRRLLRCLRRCGHVHCSAVWPRLAEDCWLVVGCGIGENSLTPRTIDTDDFVGVPQNGKIFIRMNWFKHFKMGRNQKGEECTRMLDDSLLGFDRVYSIPNKNWHRTPCFELECEIPQVQSPHISVVQVVSRTVVYEKITASFIPCWNVRGHQSPSLDITTVLVTCGYSGTYETL